MIRNRVWKKGQKCQWLWRIWKGRSN